MACCPTVFDSSAEGFTYGYLNQAAPIASNPINLEWIGCASLPIVITRKINEPPIARPDRVHREQVNRRQTLSNFHSHVVKKEGGVRLTKRSLKQSRPRN